MADVQELCESYLSKVFRKARSSVREESYYPVLEEFLRKLGEAKGKKLQIDSFPKKTEAGNPDIRVLDAQGRLVGYIEAKPPEKDALETIEDQEQLERYRKTFPNLILTNFLEFRLYRNGELVGKPAKISDLHPFIGQKFKKIPIQNKDALIKLLDQFFSFTTPRIYTAKALAVELAKKTRFLRDEIIEQELIKEEKKKRGSLLGFYQAFKKHLIASLTPKDFANLYAQTITYGLFIARHRYEMHPTLFEKEKRPSEPFNRELAYKYIQPSLGILRDVFKFISSAEPSSQLALMVDDIADVLAVADLEKVVKSFHKEGKGRDPIIHFYETFLAEYDPEEREKRGVYYTPEPVVSFIAQSIHYLLKEKFDKEDGFATSTVTVLDPAAGTLTFPALAIQLAVEEYKKKYGSGGIKRLIRDHILKNFYAFELMMAPYTVGHLKIDFILEKLGYKLEKDDRFKLFLTNTLEIKELEQSPLPGVASLSEESKKAGRVKRKIPILVIFGNPPYSGISENVSEIYKIVPRGQAYKTSTGKIRKATRTLRIKEKTFIGNLIEEYKQINGKPLGERKHWLQDDYVKFFRFAQWKIEQAGVGILGFITNHAWLDNPTFRGMRYSLMKSFDEIYILNLHGSTLKKEKTPEGGKDENVFDIRPGVAISIFVKLQNPKEKQIFYTDQWGFRREKYSWLEEKEINSTKWQTILPTAPFYFFVPREEKGRERYESFPKVTEIFPVHSTGVLTGRDKFVIDFDKKSLEARLRIFRDSTHPDDFVKEAYKLKDKPNYRWFISKSRQQLRELRDWEKCFIRILYRPFDERWIYYHPAVVFWPRPEVMQHMLRPNLALITSRMTKGETFKHALVSQGISEVISLSPKTSNNAFVFPLYLYHKSKHARIWNQEQMELIETGGQLKLSKTKSKVLNVKTELYSKLESRYKKTPRAEDFFGYIYAILYSNTYRKKYEEFLRVDFPRIPLTSDYKLFQRLAELGKELVSLHLLESRELSKSIAKFYGKNNNLVEKREYVSFSKPKVAMGPKIPQKFRKTGLVMINDDQCFVGITPEVWNYHIGGYQVLDKWLKDHKGRVLSSDDIKHYCKMVTVIAKTIEIQRQIDDFYPKVEKNLI